MTKNPRTAVIVINYNGENLLGESLSSLSEQSYPNYQIYLSDSNSEDNSVAFVKKNFPRVKVLASNKNLGCAGLSNFAVSRTKEEYIILMSNDMKFDKNCVAELVKTVQKDPKIGIASSVLVKYQKDPQKNGYVIDNAGMDMDIYGFNFPHLNGRLFSQIPQKTFEVFASCGGSFCIRREVYEQASGFDKVFFYLSDDIDLSWRVRLLGYKIVVNPKSFLYHRQSVTLGQIKRIKTRFISERNILRMILKNYSKLSLIKILPRYFLLELGEFFYYLLTLRVNMSLAILKAFWWNLINLKDTLKQRKNIQTKRRVKDDKILKMLSKQSYKFFILLNTLKKKKLV